jgi:hypothetical protein
MKWKDIPDSARQKLLSLYESGNSLDNAAVTLGINSETLRRRLREYRYQAEMTRKIESGDFDFSFISSRKWNDYLVLEADDLMVISDLELPDTDEAVLQAFLMTAIRYNIRRMVILGDGTAQDQHGLSTWLSTWKDSESIDFGGVFGILNRLIRLLLECFDEIYYVSGNHDQRIAKVTNGQVHMGLLLQHFGGRVHFSQYRRMYLKTSRGTIGLFHQSNFSANGLSLSRKMYNVEPGFDGKKLSAIVVAHIHHWSCGKSDDNLAGCYSLGCARAPERTQYLNETPSTHSQWSQGFMRIQNGFIHNYDLHETDWDEVLGEYAKGLLFHRPLVKTQRIPD